ncbi:hypothetical protein Zmor_007418 [Zophobas morio]|uniref:Uncharacterized protein n=1 Tax=Zophobas morio TaxID=2755281 RepID=A0AA38IY75_9CUCU|nr:hypothetical protein Zmor_007418 [Zophobas morio]
MFSESPNLSSPALEAHFGAASLAISFRRQLNVRVPPTAALLAFMIIMDHPSNIDSDESIFVSLIPKVMSAVHAERNERRIGYVKGSVGG